ncbi:protein GVQW3-like [Hermetia illucens]|uniref:protein GVQW3-like n=1 Tax=Hermetia illucens TaxID=343691 RepID=UPI0018CC1516|nr:protein GVQW3-like [Hermetia illucens]
MLKTAYGNAALSKTRVYDLFSRFKNGEMSIEDQLRLGCPSTSRIDENVDKINALVREDRRRTIDQLYEQRERRLQACFELKNQLKEDPFSNVIAGDESWCYGYDSKGI